MRVRCNERHFATFFSRTMQVDYDEPKLRAVKRPPGVLIVYKELANQKGVNYFFSHMLLLVVN